MREYRLRVVFKDFNFQETKLNADNIEQAEIEANKLLVIGDSLRYASLFFAEGKNRWNYTNKHVKLLYSSELAEIAKMYAD